MLIAFAANAYDFQSGGIYYKINSGGSSVTVTTGDSGSLYSGTISIPATVTNNGKTYNVTAIGANTFKQCSELESITIGSKVKFIDDYAFTNCSALKEETSRPSAPMPSIAVHTSLSSPLKKVS